MPFDDPNTGQPAYVPGQATPAAPAGGPYAPLPPLRTTAPAPQGQPTGQQTATNPDPPTATRRTVAAEAVHASGDRMDLETGEVIEPAKSKALAMPGQSGTTHIAHRRDQSTALAGTLINQSVGDLEIVVLHLFQNMGKEADIYGKHEAGAWVNGLTQEAIDMQQHTVVPVSGFKEVVVYHSKKTTKRKENGKLKVGVAFRIQGEISMLPAEYLNNDEYNVVEFINWICLVSGFDYMFVVKHKSTQIKSAKTLTMLQSTRKVQGKPRGQYRLASRDTSNDEGKWKLIVWNPAGDAPVEMARDADRFEGMMRGLEVIIVDPEETAAENDEQPAGAGAPDNSAI